MWFSFSAWDLPPIPETWAFLFSPPRHSAPLAPVLLLSQPLTGTAGGFCGMNGLGRKFMPPPSQL